MALRPWLIVCIGTAALSALPPAGAGNPAAVLRTQTLQYTGVAGAPGNSPAGGAQVLRTQRLEFTGTFGHK